MADPFETALYLNARSGQGAGALSSLAGTSGIGGSGFQTGFGFDLTGSLPGLDPNSKAPTYNIKGFEGNLSAAPDQALQDTLRSANAGGWAQGVNAFLGAGWQPYEYDSGTEGESKVIKDNTQQLRDLAAGVGFDTSNYTTDQQGNQQLYTDLNKKLGSYYMVGGLSGGWDSSGGNLHSANRTLYMDEGGTLRPVSQPRPFNASQNHGYFQTEPGQDLLTAGSMILPAFGGAAGILGAGSEGTLTAGAGLGLTNSLAGMIGTGATSALTSALQGYLTSGGREGVSGILSSLAGSTLNAGVNSAVGNPGGLGQMFDTSAAGSLGAAYNPVKGMSSMVNQLGLGGEMGAGLSLFSGMDGNGINADSIKSIAAELSGGYIGGQIDPRLRGVGANAGRQVARSLVDASP